MIRPRRVVPRGFRAERSDEHAAGVPHDRICCVPHARASETRPIREVDVLVYHEEALVEAAECLEQVAADHHARGCHRGHASDGAQFARGSWAIRRLSAVGVDPHSIATREQPGVLDRVVGVQERRPNGTDVRRCGEREPASLDGVLGLPLGISAEAIYHESTRVLRPGDQIVFYTDGITEAANPAGEMFGMERLDRVLQKCPTNASDLLGSVLAELEGFTQGAPQTDDRTLVVATIR